MLSTSIGELIMDGGKARNSVLWLSLPNIEAIRTCLKKQSTFSDSASSLQRPMRCKHKISLECWCEVNLCNTRRLASVLERVTPTWATCVYDSPARAAGSPKGTLKVCQLSHPQSILGTNRPGVYDRTSILHRHPHNHHHTTSLSPPQYESLCG